MIELGPHRYGKEGIRLVKLIRDGARHTVRDLTVAVGLEGAFGRAHTEGDNSGVVATDTMKNAVYALAQEHLLGSIEAYGLALARHFAAYAGVERAEVEIDEQAWNPIANADGGAADAAFERSGRLTRTARIVATAGAETVESGLRDLAIMKTAGSAFVGFPRDRYTTLAETTDRIMATLMTARWRYRGDVPALDHDALFEAITRSVLEVFADHDSLSVQASMWLMGRAVLERHPEVDEIHLVMPNLHHWLVDLSPFGQANPNEIFVATREPHGLIDAVVRRGAEPPRR